MSKKEAKEEEDVFEFLNSLPESDKNGDAAPTDGVSKTSGKTDDDILDFLNELEANDKKKKSVSPAPKAELIQSKPFEEKKNAALIEEVSLESPVKEKERSIVNESVNDPITSFSSWWSKEGSARVSSQMSSFWGTAQSLRQTAQEKAEEAIKIATESSLEDNLKNAFKEVGITGVLEGNRELTDDEKKELLKVPDIAKTLGSLNKGLGFFQSSLSNVIDKIQHDLTVSASRDEILDIKFVHDFKNYPNLAKYVRSNIENVMRSQVDGDIDVLIEERGITSNRDGDAKDLGLFMGKISDGEKLIQANIESIIKEIEKQKESVEETKTSNARVSELYIGLLASTNNSQTSLDEDSTITIDSYSPNCFTFTTILVDKTHDITIVSRSQPFPLKWAKWLDGSKESLSISVDETEEEKKEESSDEYLVDPSEWVVDWIERGLDMTFGILSQTYIIKRMGY